MEQIVYLNGEFIPYSEARVSIDDRGYTFGDGVYEVIAIYNGKPFRMEEHFVRLRQSAEALDIRVKDYQQLKDAAYELLKRNQLPNSAQMYIQVTRGSEPRKHLYSEDLKPNVVMNVKELKRHPEEVFLNGNKAISVADERWPRCYIKSIILLPNILVKNQAKRFGAFEAIQIRDGFLTEGSSSNVFVVKNGQLLTPPATNYILNGITRRVVLEEAPKLEIVAREKSISTVELFEADEVFLTGTTTEIMPIVNIDGRMVNHGKPGPITMKIMEHYHKLIGVK